MTYLTPDSAPTATVCRKIIIPDDKFWLSIVNGALSELGYAYNYKQFGTATPEETAAVFQQAFIDYLDSVCMDGQILISNADTTPGYLEDKLLAGTNVTLAKGNTGANETLTIAASGSGGAAEYPKWSFAWHRDSIVLSGSAISAVVSSTQIYNHVSYQPSPALNDEFKQTLFVDAGTYTFEALGLKTNASGKITWYLDDVSIGEQDWYAASTTNNVSQKITSLTISAAGNHTIRGKVTGKNASSSNYVINLMRFGLFP